MTTRPLLFAFIADRLSAARVDIRSDYDAAARFTGHGRTGTATILGIDMHFVIVTEPDQLRGLELMGFAFVRSALRTISSYKRQNMELIAGTRLRQSAVDDSVNTDRK